MLLEFRPRKREKKKKCRQNKSVLTTMCSTGITAKIATRSRWTHSAAQAQQNRISAQMDKQLGTNRKATKLRQFPVECQGQVGVESSRASPDMNKGGGLVVVGGVGGYSGRYVVAPYVHVGSDTRASLLRPFITAHMFYDSLYAVLLQFPWRLHTVPPGHQQHREVPCCRITLLCLTTMMAVQ